MWKVKVFPEVSSQLGACGLSRTAILRVLSGIHQDLPQEANTYRARRSEEDEHIFLYPMRILDQGRWHRIDLAVNDASAEGFLLVEALSHEVEP